jgi:exopolysaccharide production protein ExoZ
MKLKSIQFLRAVAVLLVVYLHSIALQADFTASAQQNFLYLRNFGGIGVDLFFAISGFIICYVAGKYMGFDAGIHFLKKRFTRINPIYYLATLLFLLALMAKWYSYNESGGRYFNKSIRSLVDTLVIFPFSSGTDSFSPLLVVGWTLSFEWLFYLLFFILILFRIRNKFLLLTIGFTIMMLAGIILKSSDLRILFLTNPLLLEFLLGVLIYWLYSKSKIPPPDISILLIIIGVVCYALLIIYGYGYIWGSKVFYVADLGLKRFILWGLPSSLIVAGCIFLEANGKYRYLWFRLWVQHIGDASYSIYLTHMSIFFLLKALYNKTGIFLPPDINILTQAALAIFFGIGFYKIIEKPLLQSIHNGKEKTSSIKNKQMILE